MNYLSPLWLPFTQMQAFDASCRTFVRGEGNYLYDSRGHKVFDAVSSIWTTIHGHCHPHIVAAIAGQAARLDHATTLGATNPVAEDLAERLCALTGFDHAFFASDGASAIEAAIKMALQYWQNAGEPRRKRFVKLVQAYHGDTIGAMSVSDIEVFKRHFEALTFDAIPYGEARDVFARDDIAAVIVEPIVQAAAGMQIVPDSLYDGLRNIKPLLIVDEIATGFGRTGTMFAFEQLQGSLKTGGSSPGLRPDILCAGKGITGGTLALSATLVRSHVYEAFLGDSADLKQFFHGHSYAGNPIACAAAVASLELFESERTLENVRARSKHVAERIARLRTNAAVRDVRQRGLMIGIEILPQALPPASPQALSRTLPQALPPGSARRGGNGTPAWEIADRLYDTGHFTRPIGNVVQFVPPLASTRFEIGTFFDALESILAGNG